MNDKYVGKRIIDITSIIEQFEADEGDVEHIIGATGMGKTYEATRRGLKYLKQGYVVYTTWKLNLPDYYDERDSFLRTLWNFITFKDKFFRFDYKNNWKYVDLDQFVGPDGIFDTEKLAIYLATRTDCVFMLDEGQDVFDSHKRAGQIARQSITRTRHMHKKLIVISQRAQAVDVNVRGNVVNFYKCERIDIPFLPPYFRVYQTEEIDNTNNYPIWVRHDSTGKEVWKAKVYYSGFGKKEVFDAYDSWYMRKNMERSQTVSLEAYSLSFKERLNLLLSFIFKKRNRKKSSIELSPPLKKRSIQDITKGV